MSDKVSLIIDVTLEERQHIEDLARQHGFDSPGDYLLSLVEDEEISNEAVLANLRQGLQELKRGEVRPVETLWDDLDDE